MTLGGSVDDVVGPTGASGAFHLGGRGDTLFFRNRGRDMALGPYVDVATSSFHNLDWGGGAEWLLPVRDDLPVVLSVGGFFRNGSGRQAAPGAVGTCFFGSRSYNFHSWYGMTNGVFLQGRWLPSTPATLDVVIGLQLDAELLVLPALLVSGAFAKQ